MPCLYAEVPIQGARSVVPSFRRHRKSAPFLSLACVAHNLLVYLHPCNEASNMSTSFKYKSLFAALCLAGTAACSSESSEDAGMPVTTASRGMSGLAADLKTAEGMIDAFYSFDP